jgi:C4-dicarboxylate-binding protein DctP
MTVTEGTGMRLLVYLFFSIVCAILPVSGLRAGQTVLRLTLQQSVSDPIGQNIIGFKKEIEAKTNGSLKIEVLDKGQLYPDYQVPEAIGGGAVEMGVTQLAQYSQFVSVAGIFMQPFLFNFEAIVRAAARPGGDIRRMIDGPIVKETGARVLWWEPHGWNVIFSKGPITNPNAIANRNVRVFDDVAAEFVQLCGGTPQVISESKQVEALDLNLIDSSMASSAAIKTYDLWRKTDTISDIRHSANILVIMINEDVWQKIPPDQKAIVLDAAKNAEAASWADFDESNAEIYRYASAKGMSVKRPTADELVEWRVCSSSILESFMSRAGRAGAELLAAYGRLRADPCCGVDSAPRQHPE